MHVDFTIQMHLPPGDVTKPIAVFDLNKAQLRRGSASESDR